LAEEPSGFRQAWARIGFARNVGWHLGIRYHSYMPLHKWIATHFCSTRCFNMFLACFNMFQHVSIGFMMLGKKWIPMASQPDDQMPSQASRFRWRAWVSAMALQILRLAKKSENLDDIGSFHTENDKVVGCCGGCL
jgi:hypothetical protein